ncbi:hypothetical protein EXIGLDRAFT_762720 [Exidia glandulosa HHB12029]|uniref:Alpha-type protein kinase domain-containing protein n=1 Tax=Exidia glandulosa HHB12029 TaxID=1314781 RepID=A0A165ML40_EXIGL|nr:hypothetical protein EXIGLDRAFT_762720 [Exidia glandulosa HHB12029]
MVRCKGCGGEFEARRLSWTLLPPAWAVARSIPTWIQWPQAPVLAAMGVEFQLHLTLPAANNHLNTLNLTAFTYSKLLILLLVPRRAQLSLRVVARGAELSPPVPGPSNDFMTRSSQALNGLTLYPPTTPLETNMTRRPLPKNFKEKRARSAPQRGAAAVTRPSSPQGIFVSIRDVVFTGVKSPPPFDPGRVFSHSFSASAPWNEILHWILAQGVKYTSTKYTYTILPEDVRRDIAVLLFRSKAGDKGQMFHHLPPLPGSTQVTLGQFFMYHGFGAVDMEHYGHFLDKTAALEGRLEVRLQIAMNEEELEKAELAAAAAGPSAVPLSPIKSSSTRRGIKHRPETDGDGEAEPEEDEFLNGRTRRTSPFEPYRVTAWRAEIHLSEDEDNDDDFNTLTQVICLVQEGDTPFDVCVSREPTTCGARLNAYRLRNDSTRAVFIAKRFSNFGCGPPVTIETNYQELCSAMVCREMVQQIVTSFFRELGGCSLYSSTFELAQFMLYKVSEGKDCGLAWIVDPLQKDPPPIVIFLSALEANGNVQDLAVQTFAALAHYSFVISNRTWLIAAAQGTHTAGERELLLTEIFSRAYA